MMSPRHRGRHGRARPGHPRLKKARRGCPAHRCAKARCPSDAYGRAWRGIGHRPTLIASELHARGLFELGTALAKIEKRALYEAEHSGEQRRRELLDARIVFLHRIVEEAAGGRELVFDIG